MLLKAVPKYKFLKVILPKKGVFYGGPNIPSIRSIPAQPGYYGRQICLSLPTQDAVNPFSLFPAFQPPAVRDLKSRTPRPRMIFWLPDCKSGRAWICVCCVL